MEGEQQSQLLSLPTPVADLLPALDPVVQSIRDDNSPLTLSARRRALEVCLVLESCCRLGSWLLLPQVVEDWSREMALDRSAQRNLPAAHAEVCRLLEMLPREPVLAAAVAWAATCLSAGPFGDDLRSEPRDVNDELAAALIAGDQRFVEALVEDAITTSTFGDLVDEVLAPALSAVGRSWQAGELTEAHAARAARMLEQASARLALEQAPAASQRARVVTLVPADDPHRLGLEILKNLLETNGWRVDSVLGDAHWPARLTPGDCDVLAVSVTLATKVGLLAEQVRSWRDRYEEAPFVIGGGRVLARAPELARDMRIDVVAKTASLGLARLESWLESRA